MKKLIKADLTGILRLVSVYLPATGRSIDQNIAELGRCERADYLFLARRTESRLFDLPSVCTPDSSENLTWIYGADTPDVPATALFLQVDMTVAGRPWGGVTLLDYRAVVRDVEAVSTLPEAQRDRHIRLITKRWTRNVRYCTILEVIQYLKAGGRCQWM